MNYTYCPEDDQLIGILQQIDGAMNLEELDGFFSALLCGPELMLPSAYIPVIIGGKIEEKTPYTTETEVKDFFGLLLQHWDRITLTLSVPGAFKPMLCKDAEGAIHGNQWAKGFLRGVGIGGETWKKLFHDDVHGKALFPILALAHENTTDPRLKPYAEPIDAKKRELLLMGIAEGIPAIYHYFEPLRMSSLLANDKTAPKTVKAGRNELCPCGSGKKYKKCCNIMVLH